MADLAKYRKLVVAGAGFLVILLGNVGLDTAADADDQVVQLFDAVVGVVTAFGVYRVPNKGGLRGV